MYKGWSRKIGIRYILGVTGLFIAGVVLFGALLFAMKHRGVDISAGEAVLYSLLLALIPSSSFSGFVVAFSRVGVLSKGEMIALVVLCVPLTVAMVPFGLVMILPSIAATIKSKKT